MHPRTAPRRRHRFDRSVDRALVPLYHLDNWHGPAALMEDMAVIGVAVWLSTLTPWLYPVSVLLIGSRQRALATLLHESAHRTLARNKTLNGLLGSVCSGWLIFQTWHRYRQTHVIDHHRHLGEEPHDPDVRHYVSQGLYDPAVSPFGRRSAVAPFAVRFFGTQLRFLVRDRLLPVSAPAVRRAALAEYFGFLLFWVAILGVLWRADLLHAFVLLWVVPYLTTFQVINWMIEVAEHFPLTRMTDTELEMSRNRHGNLLERFLTGMHAESWHLVHHLRPAVPYWNLRRAHDILMRDPAYAAVNQDRNGLLTPGAHGAPSIITDAAQAFRRHHVAP